MALHAPNFVGLTRSTFSDMATLQKCSIQGRPVAGHYVYNIIGDQLSCRTDEGSRWDPIEAYRAASAAARHNEVPR
jgi:hypothetical protein